MALGILLLGVPVLIYILLAALRPGRSRTAVFAVVGAAIVALFVARALSVPPFTGVARADDEMVWATLALTGAWVAAALVQAARPRLGRGYGVAATVLPCALVTAAILALAI